MSSVSMSSPCLVSLSRTLIFFLLMKMAPKDRLAEFRKGRDEDGRQSKSTVVIPLLQQDAIDRYLDQVEGVRHNIELLETKLAALNTLHDAIICSPTVIDEDKEAQDRAMGEIKRLFQTVHNQMQSLESAIGTSGSSNISYKIKKMQYTALARRLMNVTLEYSRQQTSYRERCKARIRRQLTIVDADANQRTDEQMEVMLETHNPQIFSQGILADSQKAKDALADVEARHQDIIKLEKDLVEIRDLFSDVALLIETQGETMDRLEDNMERAAQSMKGGKEETAEALVKQRSARKKKVILLLVLVVLLIVAAISLAGYFGGR
ncbi:hypothetical protein RvY_14892-2 [Ramazzottius varieornatus]|nr:hypothetical protein RvY_14892-2 [Ramazzottius varieornatus]